MMWNVTCDTGTYSSYFILNTNCTSLRYPVTSIEYGIMAGTGYILFVITYLFYNSVKIFNQYMFMNAISNYWWNAYFLLLAIRSTVMSIQYYEHSEDFVFFYANWLIGGFEVLFLCYALSYQHNYRSLNLVNQEIEEEDIAERSVACKISGTLRVCQQGGVILFFEFILMIAAIIMLRVAKNWAAAKQEYIFWCYVAFLGVLHITAILISLTISWKHQYDGPYVKTKFFLIVAVLINCLESIPIFIWNNCVHIQCIGNILTLFDIMIIVKIFSVLLIYLALHYEHFRLKEECQFLVLSEVPIDGSSSVSA